MNHQTNCNILDCTTNISNHNINDQVILEINDIDDLAIAWIAYRENDTLKFIRIEEDEQGIAVPLHQTQWLWDDFGKHGKGKVNITQWILRHWDEIPFQDESIYLVIGIYDFPYNRWASAGKWSFDANLTINSQIFWHKHDFGKSDTTNGEYGYGLKYLKLIKISLENTYCTQTTQNTNKSKTVSENKYQIYLSEIIQKDIADAIKSTIEKEYNFIKKEHLEKEISSEYKDTDIKAEKKLPYLLYIFDILIVLLFATLYKQEETVPYLQKIFYNNFDILDIFISSNIILLIIFFFGYKLGGMAWELVLRKKHNKELDTFMVILGLLFTAAFGAITSFDFEADKINNSIYLIGIFILYITTNFVLLYILTVISTYIINTLNANKPMVFTLIFFIGIGIFIQEIINFEQSYKKDITKVEICGINNAVKK